MQLDIYVRIGPLRIVHVLSGLILILISHTILGAH